MPNCRQPRPPISLARINNSSKGKHLKASNSKTPWYREPWAWVVAAPIFLVFAVCAVLVTTAVRFADDVVTDDYYKEGKLVNHRFAAEAFAVEHDIAGSLTLDAGAREFLLKLNTPLNTDDRLVLKLSHPVEADFDQTFELKRRSLTGYAAPLNSLPEGRWYVRVEGFEAGAETLTWRLSGEVDFSSVSTLDLQ